MTGPNYPANWPDAAGDPASQPHQQPWGQPGVPQQPSGPGHHASQHPGQSYPTQPYPGQQSYPAQSYPGQQSYPAQSYPGQQPYPGYPPQAYPAEPTQTAPPPKKRSGMRILGSVLAFVLVAGAIAVVKGGLRSLLDGDEPPGPAPVTLAGPFHSTPAEAYPEGEAGITLPEATPLPGFSEAKVQAALAQVRKGLIAARLDPTMLVTRDHSALVNLLAPDLRPDIEKDFADSNFLSYASQIAPGYALTDDPIRAKGEVTFTGRTEAGVRVLEVVTKFVWIYPFTGELKSPGDHLVIVQDEVHWLFPADADVEKSARGMWINEAQSFATNIDCDLLEQSLLALGRPRLVPGGAEEDPDAAFDPNRSFEIEETC